MSIDITQADKHLLEYNPKVIILKRKFQDYRFPERKKLEDIFSTKGLVISYSYRGKDGIKRYKITYRIHAYGNPSCFAVHIEKMENDKILNIVFSPSEFKNKLFLNNIKISYVIKKLLLRIYKKYVGRKEEASHIYIRRMKLKRLNVKQFEVTAVFCKHLDKYVPIDRCRKCHRFHHEEKNGIFCLEYYFKKK